MMRDFNKTIFSWCIILLGTLSVQGENGYKLWLRYEPVTDQARKEAVTRVLGTISVPGSSPTFDVIREELRIAATGMLGKEPDIYNKCIDGVGLIIGTPESCHLFKDSTVSSKLRELGPEGYRIAEIRGEGKNAVIIVANEPVGALYGTFHLLRILQSTTGLSALPVQSKPRIMHRLLNHWDNLDRTVERGYAGFSIWNWHKLPDYIDQRYRDYARANASIGINGSVVTNVNANSLVLSPEYIKKVAALADAFRPYGIKLYLTARFSAPMELGKLPTADPLDPGVQEWWKKKATEIYEAIPDFGGFLVKANSEGQPGPQNYDRSHADGANMLADAVVPYGGTVMWRAFVYSADIGEDRAKQAYNEFVPLDGQFRDNVIIQVKNGPVDFQPREPFHPLFGAMKKTPLAMEFQITQEYLGQATQLVYLAPLFKECLESDTYKPEKGSTVARIIDGEVFPWDQTAMAGVSNIGNDCNWTGHPFGQANWYAFGRLAWDYTLTSGEIAEDWIRLTFGNDPEVIETIKKIMLASREAAVNYMTPMGLHHIMGRGHHYGPGPWVTGGRADWTSVYYHQADTLGIGFDRTTSGSDALGQYAPEVQQLYEDPETCPEEYLLWFHHLPWDFHMKSGNSLWDELCFHYDRGVSTVGLMIDSWSGLEGKVDSERFREVSSLLTIQEKEARWWRNACLLYFQQFSRRPFPEEIEQPEGDLETYEKMQFPYAPGTQPSRPSRLTRPTRPTRPSR
jgi:alpha-glucuronidase